MQGIFKRRAKSCPVDFGGFETGFFALVTVLATTGTKALSIPPHNRQARKCKQKIHTENFPAISSGTRQMQPEWLAARCAVLHAPPLMEAGIEISGSIVSSLALPLFACGAAWQQAAGDSFDILLLRMMPGFISLCIY